MKNFLVHATACCPTRHCSFEVEADATSDAFRVGADYIEKNLNRRSSSKHWQVIGVESPRAA